MVNLWHMREGYGSHFVCVCVCVCMCVCVCVSVTKLGVTYLVHTLKIGNN